MEEGGDTELKEGGLLNIHPHPFDVLISKKDQHHTGNLILANIIIATQEQYRAIPQSCKLAKKEFVHDHIITPIHRNGGRFLIPDGSHGWKVATTEQAKKSIMLKLRRMGIGKKKATNLRPAPAAEKGYNSIGQKQKGVVCGTVWQREVGEYSNNDQEKNINRGEPYFMFSYCHI